MKNLNKYKSVAFLGLIALGMTYCTPFKTPSSQTAPIATTVSPTPPTVSIETPTVSPTAMTSSITPDRLVNKCLKIVENSDLHLSGILVLHEFRLGVNTYLLDLQNGEKINLGNTLRTVVSPDGTKIAFSDLGQKALIIANVNGKRIKTIPDNASFMMEPARWLDNNRLAIDKPRRTSENQTPILDALDILNLTTGEIKEFLPEYPHFYDIPGEVKWSTQSRLIVNPTLAYLVYPALEHDSPTILWDIRSASEVVRIHWGETYYGTPQWASDGTHFITSAPIRYEDANNKTFVNVDDDLPYVGGQEIIDVSQSGEVKRLSFLTTQYTAWESNYSWSPDGQFIAFGMELNGDSSNKIWQLGILDVKTGETTNYCISGQYLYPSWSLDGKNLAIDVSPDRLRHQVFVMDIEKNIAVQIAENSVTSGWMASEK